MAFLLDTNVLSELRKGRGADANVRKWIASIEEQGHYISVLSIGEIRKGIELLRSRSPEQCPTLDHWLDQIQRNYEDQILLVTEAVAEQWGRLMAVRTLPAVDGYIAATALVNGLTVVTRNTRDFEGTDVAVLNPWE
jgi:predicted nucleic acid-binding protein